MIKSCAFVQTKAGVCGKACEDDHEDYGEVRLITAGMLRERMVVMVWTPRNVDDRHLLSMRKANEREQAQYTQHLD